MATFPHLSQQELVRAFAEEYLDLKLRDDDFTNPQVISMSCTQFQFLGCDRVVLHCA